MTQLRHRFGVTDDSGFLALVDHHAYPGFVDKDWTYDALLAHFRAATEQRSLLLWETGGEESWTVEVVVDGPAAPAGFRRTAGTIRVTAGQLHLVNYESLTMAAQFDHVRLPEPHLCDLVFDLPNGEYGCEIVQLDDPDADSDHAPDPDQPHFVVRLTADPQAG
ncbi:hypothetical protein [Plantactinospora sp. B5E13]|uniref:hypothetical protein n=1 Tax=unclassified Plantactinospora TaxID=2631981 RepID=UPI00325CCAA3